TRTMNNTRESNEFLWQRWISANKSIQSWKEKADNNSDQRKWYQRFTSDRNTSKLVWSVTYNYSNNAEPVIIATKRFTEPNQAESSSVARADIRLSEIIKDIETEHSGDKGRIFLVSPGKEVLMPSPSERQSHIQFLAATEWLEKGEHENKAFTLKALGENWWCSFLPLQKENDSGWIAVTIPESKLVTDSEQTSWIIAVWVSAVLLLGIVLSLILARRYKKYFRENSSRILACKDIEPQIENLLTEGENPNLEFKSTVRTNLKTGKPDKDIEFAWLKTLTAFLNTQGGILLIGVDDSGQVSGLKNDNFGTTDKCLLHLKNLIHQHIGPAFSRFIDFEIVLFHGKSIVVIECEPASIPSFLRKGQSEDFFIRSGPASVPLNISQTIDYLQHRSNSKKV
ncbi:MAG: RNA-binding domain-containing protein, partial [Desulfonatronovibrio sp.]